MWISSSTSRLKQLLPDETWRDCSVYLVTQAAIMSQSGKPNRKHEADDGSAQGIDETNQRSKPTIYNANFETIKKTKAAHERMSYRPDVSK